jgi:hypothetical protein
MKRAWLIAGGLAAVVIVATAALARRGRSEPVEQSTTPIRVTGGVRAPDGARVRVQVLNGTKTRGLARRATMLLRDRGFDVVEMGTITSGRDTTVVLDLSGHPDWANSIAKLFPPARVETRADSSRYLDIAIVLGTAWRPPAEPFYP